MARKHGLVDPVGTALERALEEYVSEAQQIEQLKGWTKENGPWMLAGVAIVALGFAGYQQWQRWQDSKSLRANESYTQVLNALAKGDRAGAAKLADALRADYERTPYADQADLALARAYVENNELGDADKHLALVVAHSRDAGLRLLARYRLARVQRAEGHPDDAIKTLSGEAPFGFAAAFAELRGDIAADRGDSAQALKAYQEAETAGTDGVVNREQLELKIAALGGTPADEPKPADAPVQP